MLNSLFIQYMQVVSKLTTCTDEACILLVVVVGHFIRISLRSKVAWPVELESVNNFTVKKCMIDIILFYFGVHLEPIMTSQMSVAAELDVS